MNLPRSGLPWFRHRWSCPVHSPPTRPVRSHPGTLQGGPPKTGSGAPNARTSCREPRAAPRPAVFPAVRPAVPGVRPGAAGERAVVGGAHRSPSSSSWTVASQPDRHLFSASGRGAERCRPAAHPVLACFPERQPLLPGGEHLPGPRCREQAADPAAQHHPAGPTVQVMSGRSSCASRIAAELGGGPPLPRRPLGLADP